MNVRYTGPASRDLASLLAYTQAHWPRNVEQVLARIVEVERLLSRFPTMAPVTERRTVRKYSLKPLPYALFYRATTTEVEILRIYHVSQQPSAPGDM